LFAECLARGRGVKPDLARARELLQRACSEDPLACERGEALRTAPNRIPSRFLDDRPKESGAGDNLWEEIASWLPLP
ncbi:MAG: SEL1-like repeat protein, partial [Dehalococcoidia bacterium]